MKVKKKKRLFMYGSLAVLAMLVALAAEGGSNEWLLRACKLYASYLFVLAMITVWVLSVAQSSTNPAKKMEAPTAIVLFIVLWGSGVLTIGTNVGTLLPQTSWTVGAWACYTAVGLVSFFLSESKEESLVRNNLHLLTSAGTVVFTAIAVYVLLWSWGIALYQAGWVVTKAVSWIS